MNRYYVDDIGGHLWLRDETDVFGLVQTGHYETEEAQTIKKLVKPNDLCIDIGANIGYFTVLMAKIARYCYAFEPEPENFRLLIKNIAENELEMKTYPLMTAIGMITGLGELYKCPSNHGMHRLYPSKWCENTSIPVSIISLDEEFRGLLPNFIKMDTEGYELQAILGMKTMLIKAQPILLVEFHPETLREQGGESTPRDLFETIEAMGYGIYLAPDIKNRLNYATLHYKTNDSMGGQNIVCIPLRS